MGSLESNIAELQTYREVNKFHMLACVIDLHWLSGYNYGILVKKALVCSI